MVKTPDLPDSLTGERSRKRWLSPSRRGSDFLPGNQISLLQSGAAYFPALEAAFDRARFEIYLVTYIYQDDATGQRIADALKRAVLRGVEVFLLIDGYGSKDLPKPMLERMRTDGVRVLVYRPQISPWTFRRKRLRRMHRKVAVVDREVAFVGGINIVDDREPTEDLPPRYDFAVVVGGPLVEEIRLSARRQWSMVAWARFRKGAGRSVALPGSTTGGSMSAAFVTRDNYRHRRDIEAAYLQGIDRATSEIILCHAYFLPGVDFRHALTRAAERGVRVVLLLQGRMEFFLQHYASRALYGHFLDAGIEIYEYRKGFLHAKVAVIDGHWATVGSSNIDPFSLLLSREANVVVDDEVFAVTLARSLMKTVETDGERILRDTWKKEPLGLRFISWLSYGMLRLMMVISGYAPEHDRLRRERPLSSEK
ncbi:phosphatidylserine/phosphatidylglycerophosphate/cardiolipin synthase [Desulfuromonas soudanensis]|uniref:Phosphatidylserine/phosphatidylglycerophosphate/ cardiolipin synthase n=1 Tax=Desulfuromonas soudanensis TaxID=1603606 RepID=A0A0M4CYL9_9BACT|nr:cardiolipin synthase ClsB [Desulfuromonas soudanensis]ALC14908.1 phosphatidylserine/phosphatidylglycerophosphate/cardiolipin synthase [Desulfuromonas soudanensis]